MSDKTVYAIQDRNEALLIAGLARAGDARWRVVEWRDLSVDETPPRDLARDLAVAPMDVTWLLNNHEVQIGSAALPHLKAKEMERAVAGWIARAEKGATDGYAYAWRELPAAAVDAETRDLVLTYAERDVIQSRLDRAAAWDVKPGRMQSAYMALDAFFRVAGPCAEGPQVWSLVFLGKTCNFLCVGSQDCLLMTRPLLADLSGGENPGEYVERLATEVTRSLFFARQSAGSPEVQRIVVCGDTELSPRLRERLADEQAIPVDHWDLAGHFDADGHDVDADGLLVLAAAALGGVTGVLNLVKEPRRGPFGPRARRRVLIAAVALAATITPLLWFAGSTLTTVQDDYLRGARRQLREAQRDAREAQALYRNYRLMQSRRALMEAHRASTPALDRLLLDLATSTPVQITFTDLRITTAEDGMRLTLAGESRAPSAERAQQAFLDFVTTLDSCEILGGTGEPRRLEIDRPDEPETAVKRVVFSLDYDLKTTAVEGSAE